jgi:hypothetical protein
MSGRRAWLLSLTIATTGCGYALVGHGITTDASIKRIGVPLFKDRTGKLNLDLTITAKVVEELQKRGRFTVVQEDTNVDAVVEGEITGYAVTPVSFQGDPGQTQASRYAVTVTARITYRKLGAEKKEIIWSNEGFSFRDEYDIGDNAASYFDREAQSIERIAQGFARSLVAAMLEAF